MSDADGKNPGPSPEASEAEASTAEDEDVEEDIDIPSEAFISPDEPFQRSAAPGIPPAAFISPDDPIMRSKDSSGVVVAMDGQVHHLANMDDPHLEREQVANILEHTAKAIRETGMAGLTVSPDAPHFEAVLKSYLAGYFGSRA